MTRISALIFDNDGVIVDTERQLVKINAHVMNTFGHTFRPELRKSFTGKPNIEGIAAMLKAHETEHIPVQEFSDKRTPLLHDWYKNPAFCPGFVEYFQAIRQEFPVPVAVASSIDPEFFVHLDKKLHISELFDNNVCLSKASVIAHKPAPDIFLYAAGYLRKPIYECAIWEDSPLGIVSALRAGAKKIIGYTGTLNASDLMESIEEALGSKPGIDILLIDDFSNESLQKTLMYLRR